MADLANATENDNDLHGDANAWHWAERFCHNRARADANPITVGMMLAWFASAIETGRMAERKHPNGPSPDTPDSFLVRAQERVVTNEVLEEVKRAVGSLLHVKAGWAFGVPEDGRADWLARVAVEAVNAVRMADLKATLAAKVKPIVITRDDLLSKWREEHPGECSCPPGRVDPSCPQHGSQESLQRHADAIAAGARTPRYRL